MGSVLAGQLQQRPACVSTRDAFRHSSEYVVTATQNPELLAGLRSLYKITEVS